VVDNTRFAKDGSASPCVARHYSRPLGKTANCSIGVSVHLVNEHASARRTGGCSARPPGMTPRLPTCGTAPHPVPAQGGRISDEARTKKWRLALEMIIALSRIGAGQKNIGV
jgi:hypothetical protein